MTKLRVALSAILALLFATALFAQQSELRTGIWRDRQVTYTWVLGADGSGKAVYQGDTLLDHVEQSPNGVHSNSLGVAYSSYLWPKMAASMRSPTSSTRPLGT